MAEEGEAAASSKSRAAAIWEQLKCKDSALAARADAVLQRSYCQKNRIAAPAKKKPLPAVPKLKIAEKSIQPAETLSGDERRKMAAAALAAAKLGAAIKKDPVVASASSPPPQVDVVAKELPVIKDEAKAEKRNPSGIDEVLEQIQKKQKINVLDKSKKDWGEFKDEKGLQDELEAYKKSGDKYLDKVAFLKRADFREYEKERDARLAFQAKRKQGVNYEG